MSIHNKKIGIWGYGITGKAVARFLSKIGASATVFDKKTLSLEDQKELRKQEIVYYRGPISTFLTSQDIIIPSSGVDLRSYKQFYYKCISELDLFAHYFYKPVIAITGTLGKTTITMLLQELLTMEGLRSVVGGNIGIGLFDLIEQQAFLDYAVIELSSFQLEHCNQFAPDVAIWTNFYPNHLDRHTTVEDYFQAKANLLRHQTRQQQALVPFVLRNSFEQKYSAHLSYFALQKPQKIVDNLFFKKGIHFFYAQHDSVTQFFAPGKSGLFLENVLILASTLTLLDLPLKTLSTFLQRNSTEISSLEHRLENVATVNEITFYNDSKSTVPQATLTALRLLGKKQILLLLGGLGKGIDREPMIRRLRKKVEKIFCFGSEARQLYEFCKKYGVSASYHEDLDGAFYHCVQYGKPGNIVLFSPAGSSFDLFENYQTRGNYFKSLVEQVADARPNSN